MYSATQIFMLIGTLQTWPVCHVLDQTNLTLRLLHAILSGKNPLSGKQGYYLGASGSIAWLDIYTEMARALAKRGVTDSDTVKSAKDDDEILGKMGKALDCPGELVPLMLGGL